jgi:acetyl-CoA acetyltransferase
VDDPFERGAIVSGIGISRIGRKSGIPGAELTQEACRAALADAGLQPADAKGLASMGDTPIGQAAATLDIQPAWTSQRAFGSGGLFAPVYEAIEAVASGTVRHALVYRTVQMIGGAIVGGAGERAGGGARERAGPSVMGDMAPLLAYHAYSAANWLAMHCRRHMYLYGTTKEQLGYLAINSRLNAARNPLAAYRDPISMDDYLNARPISDPFGLLDCDVPVDGSIAVVVSSADHAADTPNSAVRVEAIGAASGYGGWDQRPDYPKMASTEAAADMWSRTDLKSEDVDVAELYDGFTFLALAWLEALGFCGQGESGPFVEEATRIALDGPLPLNTHGGQLSAGRMHGYWLLHEACLQLRGQAGSRQVRNAEIAVAASGGGPIAGCMLLSRT